MSVSACGSAACPPAGQGRGTQQTLPHKFNVTDLCPSNTLSPLVVSRSPLILELQWPSSSHPPFATNLSQPSSTRSGASAVPLLPPFQHAKQFSQPPWRLATKLSEARLVVVCFRALQVQLHHALPQNWKLQFLFH